MTIPRGFSLILILIILAGAIALAVGGYLGVKKESDAVAPEVSEQPEYTYCPTLTRDLARGDVDEKLQNQPEWILGQVSDLQNFLKVYFAISDAAFVDGIYGPNTESEVKKFQAAMGLPTTGAADAPTKARIKQLCADPLPSTMVSHEYAFTMSQTLTLKPGEAYAETGDADAGHFRIEYVSGSPAVVRVSGRAIGGAAASILKLEVGKLHVSSNWPVGLQITLQKVGADGSLELTITEVSTD